MKSFSITLLLSASLAFAFAAPESENKDQIALQECNVTNPVERNPRTVIDSFTIEGGPSLILTPEEKCFLNCHLQKVNFLDENSDIRTTAVLNNTLAIIPELVIYTDPLIGHLYRVHKKYKGLEDKCEKAFLYYYEYTNQVISLAFATLLSQVPDIQAQITFLVWNKKVIDPKFLEVIGKTLDPFSETLVKSLPSLEKTEFFIYETTNNHDKFLINPF